jgi:hypothetical protein
MAQRFSPIFGNMQRFIAGTQTNMISMIENYFLLQLLKGTTKKWSEGEQLDLNPT